MIFTTLFTINTPTTISSPSSIIIIKKNKSTTTSTPTTTTTIIIVNAQTKISSFMLTYLYLHCIY